MARATLNVLRGRRDRLDPDGWAQSRLGLESWSVPRRIRESVRDNKYTAVHACHSSAKTHTAASIAAWWVETHPPHETFVVTTAPRQFQVETLLWEELRKMQRAGKLRGTITPRAARWTVGDELIAFGRKSADEADPTQAMQKFQGKHALYLLVVIDEAGAVDEWLWTAVDAIATSAHSRVLAIGNCDDPASHFREICEDPKWEYNVIGVSAFDTPLYTEERETVSGELLERLIDGDSVERWRRNGEDSHIWQSKVLGQFPDISDDALFPLRLIKRAQRNHENGVLAGTARGSFGADIGAEGGDETCVYRNRGGVIELEASWARKDTEESADKLQQLLRRTPGVPMVVDAVGVGKGVFDKLRRRRCPAIPFGGGERAVRPDEYPNRRTEVLWELRRAMEDGLVALDPNDEELAAQMARIKWRPHARYVCEIETKKEMRKRGVKSPDRVDAVAMAFTRPESLPSPSAEDLIRRGGSQTLTGDLLERAL